MKKFLILLLIALSLCTISACAPKNPKSDTTTFYDIIIDLDTNENTLDCYQEVLYTNNTDTELAELKFNLYPKAYRENAKYCAINEKYIDNVYYNGPSYGNIEINKIRFEGLDINYEIGGIDENILIINLPKPLQKKDKISIQLEYLIYLPYTNSRFGVTEKGINCGNFYPILCVYENGDWITEPYYDIGDPFYSEVANYSVEINTSGKGLIASTGTVIDSFTKNGINTKIIDANLVRDFAFVFLKNGSLITERLDDIDINYYYTEDSSPHTSLYAAVNSINTYGEYFGKYPYKNFNVVDTDFVFGGMEYPNMVLINSKLKGINREYTIAHETAHQWWYGVVGSNSIDNAWMDEGLTEFSSAFYFKKTKRENLYNAFIQNSHKNYIDVNCTLSEAGIDFDGIMTKPLANYPTESAYLITAYDKGQIMFASMYEIMGEKKFLNALQKYYKTYKYKNASPDDLLQCFKPQYQQLFNIWLDGKVIIPPAF